MAAGTIAGFTVPEFFGLLLLVVFLYIIHKTIGIRRFFGKLLDNLFRPETPQERAERIRRQEREHEKELARIYASSQQRQNTIIIGPDYNDDDYNNYDNYDSMGSSIPRLGGSVNKNIARDFYVKKRRK